MSCPVFYGSDLWFIVQSDCSGSISLEIEHHILRLYRTSYNDVDVIGPDMHPPNDYEGNKLLTLGGLANKVVPSYYPRRYLKRAKFGRKKHLQYQQ
jgi:hypothetical protein